MREICLGGANSRSALAIHGYTSRSPIAPTPVSRNHGMKAKLLPPFFNLSTTTFRVPRFLHQKTTTKKKNHNILLEAILQINLPKKRDCSHVETLIRKKSNSLGQASN
jgi:hypothetical protein